MAPHVVVKIGGIIMIMTMTDPELTTVPRRITITIEIMTIDPIITKGTKTVRRETTNRILRIRKVIETIKKKERSNLNF